MVYQKQLTESDAREAIETGEFPQSVRESSENVAIVLTQDWCHQWSDMKAWLDGEPTPEIDLDVYQLEYNRVPYGDEFMRFKESVLRNSLVPYVRYYRNGVLVGQSNYVSGKRFLGFFTG